MILHALTVAKAETFYRREYQIKSDCLQKKHFVTIRERSDSKFMISYRLTDFPADLFLLTDSSIYN